MSMHRILIADDNEANRELLEAYLVSIDCETEIAVDGQDTLAKVESFKPDLVLLDVMMPNFLSKPVNKIELVKRVENMLKLKGTVDELERLRRYIEEMEEPS